MTRQATAGTPVTRIETTQEAIIACGIETNEDSFISVCGSLQALGSEIESSLNDLTSGTKMSVSELKTLASQLNSLAVELDGAADELKAIVQAAKACEPAVLNCSVCAGSAAYMAPTRAVDGKVTWSPICTIHARGWWEGADWVGKMFEIGKGVVEPTEG